MALIQNGGKRQLKLKVSMNFESNALVTLFENGGYGLEQI